jgi:hypothetical protein
VYVYGLFDNNGELRYIGSTAKNPRTRFLAHIQPSSIKRERNYKNNWLRSLSAPPTFQVIQILGCESDARLAEKYWISFFRSIGCRLVNTTDGGEGSTGYRLTESHKQAISSAQKGRKRTPGEVYRNKQNQPGRTPIVDNTGRAFESIADAASKLNIDKKHIGKVVAGKRKTAGGLHFARIG